MNLIEQQNILKSLTDEALQSEVSRPTGATPPFLIATELERRKSMRDRYEGEKARKGKTSTVLEDIMASMQAPSATMGQPGGMPQAMGQPGMPQQIPMAPPEQPGGIAAFAEGGLVGSGGGLDYAALSERYNTAVNARPEREDRARALALLMAGAGMMGGGSSNTLTNIGKGISAGAGYYGDALNNIDTQEREALRDAMDLERVRNAEELQLMEFGWRQDESAADRALREQELLAGRKPASVVESEWYLNATPEERAAHDKLNPPPASATGANIPKIIDDTFESALRAIPEPESTDADTPETMQQKQNDRVRQAEMMTYQRLRNMGYAAEAELYAAQAGINPNDLLTGPSAGATVDTTSDFLNIGL